MNTKEFMEKLEKDADLQKKFEGVNLPEKFYEVACENGLTDDFETMKSEVTKYVKENGEMSEMDLDSLTQVAGGDFMDVTEAVSEGCKAFLSMAGF